MIETERLVLRPMRIDDIEPLLRVFGDPRVMAAFGMEPFDREQMRAWVQRNLDHQDHHGYGLYSVIRKATNELIGDCGLERMEIDGRDVAELGYDLRSDVWRQGPATEAPTAVRDHAFDALGVPALISVIRQGNCPSRRVAEKIGLRHVHDVERFGRPYWIFEIDIADRKGAAS